MSISKDGDPHDAGTPDAAPVANPTKKPRKPRKPQVRATSAAKKKKGSRNRSPKQDAKLKIKREKMALALEARVRGYTYREIAAEIEVDVRTAYLYVQEGLAEIPREAAEELRQVELERLDKMTSKLMDQFLETPDPMYVDAITKLMAARAKYLGFFDGPPKDPGEGSYGKSYDGGGVDQKFRDGLSNDKPQLQLPAPIVLQPDEPVPANPIL